MKEAVGNKREGEGVKPINVTLLTNDQLRPWTIDRPLEEKVKVLITELEKTKSIISPQKKAGARGNSVLDEPIPEFIQHQSTVMLQAKTLKTKFDSPVLTGPNKIYPRSPSKLTLEPLNTMQIESAASRSMSPMAQDPASTSSWPMESMELSSPNRIPSEHNADFHYIDKLQRQLQHDTRRHENQQARPASVNAVNYKRAINSAIYSIRKGEYDNFNATASRPSLSPEKARLLIHQPKPDHPTLFNIDTSSLAITHSKSLKILENITSPTKKLIIMKRALSPIKTSHGDLMISPTTSYTANFDSKRSHSPSKLGKTSPVKKNIDWGSSTFLTAPGMPNAGTVSATPSMLNTTSTSTTSNEMQD